MFGRVDIDSRHQSGESLNFHLRRRHDLARHVLLELDLVNERKTQREDCDGRARVSDPAPRHILEMRKIGRLHEENELRGNTPDRDQHDIRGPVRKSWNKVGSTWQEKTRTTTDAQRASTVDSYPSAQFRYSWRAFEAHRQRPTQRVRKCAH